ncbi:hypothetical protein QZH41_002025, partial [Actinostola sp. cb2023]
MSDAKDELRALKQYLKGDYKLLDFISSETLSSNMPRDEKDDAIFSLQAACDAIQTWKSHQLRMVHQDTARTDILDSLDKDSVLIVQDFAMKFLPAQYRETQKEFFGKRGISWHITVCLTKANSQLLAQTFVHIVESGLQDSKTVVTIMENVLQILKREHREIHNVYYRQDNAGCYHCAFTIVSCKILRERTGLNLCQFDFCDPQGGKGPCDRKAAQIKYRIKTYINQGHSVTTPKEMKTAIESDGGIEGVRVVFVEAPPGNSSKNDTKLSAVKWDGISSLYNFAFNEQGIRAFKAYGIGAGKFWPWSAFEDAIQAIVLQWIPCNLMGADFITVKCRSHGPSKESTVISPVATVESEDQDS